MEVFSVLVEPHTLADEELGSVRNTPSSSAAQHTEAYCIHRAAGLFRGVENPL